MSIKRNFLYSSFLTVANYIFPLLTFPYVSRVLGVEAIGKYNFTDNIIQIFIIVSMLGIETIGVREIAQNKTDQDKLNKSFTALLLFNAITTLIAILVLFAAIFIVPKFADYKDLLLVGSLKLFSMFLLIDWFYKGIEDFKFITQRTVIIRTLFVVSVFAFVRSPQDCLLYYFLIVFSITINAIVNLLYARKIISFSFDVATIRRIVKPILILGGYSILAWLYNSFSMSYLGFVSTDEQVGYYATASKFYNIFLSVLSAFAAVMLPRLSLLVSEHQTASFQRLITKSFNVVLTITVPFAIYAIFYAPDIVRLVAGNGYDGAVVPMRLIMPLIIIVGIEQILIIQILMPLKRDKEVLINTIWGAVTGLVLNVLLVPSYLCVGAAISWLVSEMVVMFSAIYFIRKRTEIRLAVNLGKRIVPIIMITLVTYLSGFVLSGLNYVVNIVLGGFIVVVGTYLIEKYIVKNPILNDIENAIITKVLHFKNK
ncbi:flippase [Segatella copri]|uniref:Flippase n=1 Tax=Segatella copri TaxID=165179 RepID=A0AA92T2I9_9BACT|nr:flippase [Segatella copri]RGN05373.1 flippase [Segatella copri]RGQ08590.1 flippase [Segatella copri]